MKLILYIFLLSPFLVKATPQLHDLIIFKGDTLPLKSNPLESYLNLKSERVVSGIELTMTSTACYRGYIATWEVINDSLFLVELKKGLGGERFNLEEEFGKDPVFADWLTGKLILPHGKLVIIDPDRYWGFYEFELGLIIRNGIIIDHIVYDNSKCHNSILTSNSDSLFRYIGTKLNWSIIPNLEDKQIKVYVELQSGSVLKPDSIKIAKGSAIDVLNNEALRVINTLQEWSVYYRQGKVYRIKWVIPIPFSESLRKEYTH